MADGDPPGRDASVPRPSRSFSFIRRARGASVGGGALAAERLAAVRALGIGAEDAARICAEFAQLDTDGDGSVSRLDFAKAIGLGASSALFSSLLYRWFDPRATGRISLLDFARTMGVLSSDEPEAHLQLAFRAWDVSGSGRITRDELARVISEVRDLAGPPLEPLPLQLSAFQGGSSAPPHPFFARETAAERLRALGAVNLDSERPSVAAAAAAAAEAADIARKLRERRRAEARLAGTILCRMTNM
ncbi:hypothetical protein T492DRAFT_848983 [Pavlovales sp. CCMP2436]|nr:hypothetical protein T492DRAFT_848983 [Pavlovales sp. CCMP2436]